MSPKIFVFRLIALPVIAALVVLFGGISASMLGAVPLAFLAAILFTAVSERLFRQKLFAKIGGGIITWYFVHLVYETALIALLVWGPFALLGWSASGWVAIAGGAALWLALTWDTLGSLVPLIAMYLATRK